MAAVLAVTVVMIVAAVGWLVFASPSARAEPTKVASPTTAPVRAPTVPTSLHAFGNDRAIVLAALPSEFDRDVAVRIRSEKGTTYRVNLGQLTCTCPDFQKRRASLPPNDIRRVCKHLGRTLEAKGALSHYDEVALAFILPPKASRGRAIDHGVNAGTMVQLADGADKLVLAFRADTAWVDVVTRRGTGARIKNYKRYSYNVDERRWSYGSAPFSDGEIRQVIHAHFHG